MRLGGWRSLCYYSALGLQWFCVFGLAVFSAAQAFEPDSLDVATWGRIVPDCVMWLQIWGKVAIPALTGLLVLGRSVCHFIGPPWVWNAIHAILDEFREHAFHEKTARDQLHHHRVTLFKYVRCKWFLPLESWRSKLWPWGRKRWPWSGWLIPVARSGHTTKARRTVFLAPDDADYAEGIAGATWAMNGMLRVANLPCLQGTPTAEEISAYARKSFVTEEWIRGRLGRRAFPRSLQGISMEMKGRPWGVLILDSRSEDGISKIRTDRVVRVVAVVLDKLLRRAR